MSNTCKKCGRPISADETYCAVCVPAIKSSPDSNYKPTPAAELGSLTSRLRNQSGENENRSEKRLLEITTKMQDDINTIKGIMIFFCILAIVGLVAAIVFGVNLGNALSRIS